MSVQSLAEEQNLTLEEVNKQIAETQLFKTCRMSENNHVHHFHDELQDPTAHYKPVKGCNIEELFFDLVFVGAGGNITHGLRQGHLDWEDYFLYMGVILIFWKNFSLNRSIFDTSDLLDKFFAMWYGAGVVGLAVFSTGGLDGDSCVYFSRCCVFLSILQLLLDARGFYGMNIAIQKESCAAHRETRSYNYMVLTLVVCVVKLIFWVIFASTSDNLNARRPLLWICALLPVIVDAISSLTMPPDAQIFPPVHHMNERFEAIVLIMLGETILGITPALTYAKTNSQVMTAIMVSYFVMFLYKTFHFDVEEYREEIHALYLGGFRRVIWMYFTIVECIGVILLGSGCGELVDAIIKAQEESDAHEEGSEKVNHALRRILSGGETEHENEWQHMLGKAIQMLCVGTAVALAANIFCRLSHAIEIETFDGAMILWYVQQCTQFITVCLIIPFPIIFQSKWVTHETAIGYTYTCFVSILSILFVLDMLFFMDEIFEHIHLKNVHANMIAEAAEREHSEGAV